MSMEPSPKVKAQAKAKGYPRRPGVLDNQNMPSSSLGPVDPHRVIIQDGNRTVWTTTAGKLFRSAPEHVRLALPAEGTPGGPELPEDIMMLQNQVNRMNQQSVRADPPSLIDNPCNPEEPIIQDQKM